MDNELAIFALSAFAIVCGISIVSIAVLIGFMFNKSPEKAIEAFLESTKQDTVIRLVTVFAVLGTTTVLLFADKLSDGVLALMSAITGYVLGGLKNSSNTKTAHAEKNSSNNS